MRAGDLRDKVIFQREERVSDGMGGWETTEKTIATAWASVKVPASKDGVVAMKDTEIRSHVVRVRQNAETLAVRINDFCLWRDWKLSVKTCRPLGYEAIDFDCVLEV